MKKYLFLSLALLFFGSNLNAKSYLDQNSNTEILSKILKEIEELKKSQDKTQKAINDLSGEIKLLKGKNAAPPSDNKTAVKNVPIGNSMVLGNPKAPITVVKWTDFQWPHCARSVSLIDEVLAKYPNDVKVVVKNFPLSFHKQARKAAKYALAASRQGKYKEMYHMIMDNYRALKTNEDLPLEYASELGLNIDKFKSDAADPYFEELIKTESSQLAQNFERKSVPKFLVAGKEPSARNIDAWSAIIDLELKKIK